MDPPPAPASQPDTQPPPHPVDELLEGRLRRLHFRGARAFIWQYREHLDAVRYVLDELDQAREDAAYGADQGIRNPGGLVRWRVRQEVGDGDGA